MDRLRVCYGRLYVLIVYDKIGCVVSTLGILAPRSVNFFESFKNSTNSITSLLASSQPGSKAQVVVKCTVSSVQLLVHSSGVEWRVSCGSIVVCW